MNYRRYAAACCALLTLLVWRPAAADAVMVGALDLRPCGHGTLCGVILRRLDPTGHTGGSVHIHFQLHPATGGSTAATIVAVEGGPGYSSIGSSAGYLALFGPLRPTHNILIVDNRGTGLSDAIDCQPLQQQVNRKPWALAACGRQLGATAYRYGTAEAADDLAAVLTQLGIGRVDLYGDSYGTFFGQAFAVLHPAMLRTLVLDSAYPVIGESAWYPHQAPSARRAFDTACARTPACFALGGTSMQRITALIAAVRNEPLRGRAPDGDGRLRDVVADAPTLFALTIAESNAPTVYRELDAAARAALNGDSLPLLRLVAEARLFDPENGRPVGAAAFSEGLFVGAQCGDYPQLYDLRSDPGRRHEQLATAIARERAQHADVYAPFSIDESQAAPYNDNAIALCVDWARLVADEPLAQPIPVGAAFPHVPVLVLSGELDTVTTPAEGGEAAALFPDSTWLVVPNSIHETAISDGGNYVSPGADLTHCVSAIVLHFVTARSAGDTACLTRIRPVRAVPAFPLRALDIAPARTTSGTSVHETTLRYSAAAVATAGDVLNRYWQNYSGRGAGLRGGRFALAQRGDRYDFTLSAIAYTRDLTVSGELRWDQTAGVVLGELLLAGDAVHGHLHVWWPERAANARAVLSGIVNGERVAATCVAP